jgi:hypothetical protein
LYICWNEDMYIQKKSKQSIENENQSTLQKTLYERLKHLKREIRHQLLMNISPFFSLYYIYYGHDTKNCQKLNIAWQANKKRLMASHTSCWDHTSPHWHNQLDLLSLIAVLENNLATPHDKHWKKTKKKNAHSHFSSPYFVPECLPFDESLLLSLPLKGCLPDLFGPFEPFLDADGIWEWIGVLIQ